MGRHRAAGPFEIWAARAWNVFNEGRPFSVVYPPLVLMCAAPLGLGPDGPLQIALAGTFVLALAESRFEFPLRARALLWLVLLVSALRLEPALELLVVVGVDISVRYHLVEREGLCGKPRRASTKGRLLRRNSRNKTTTSPTVSENAAS